MPQKPFSKKSAEYVLEKLNQSGKIPSILFLVDYVLKNGALAFFESPAIHQEVKNGIAQLPQLNQVNLDNEDLEKASKAILSASSQPLAKMLTFIYDHHSEFQEICNRVGVSYQDLSEVGTKWEASYLSEPFQEKHQMYLEEYTEKMESKGLDAVYERPDLLRRIINSLSNHDKRLCLISGESGTGKRSLVYSLVAALERDDIPNLKEYRVLRLNTNALLGNNMRNDAASRLNQLLGELKDKKYVLFVDNINDLVDVVFKQNSLLNNLKNSVLKGEVKVIATLPEHFEKSFKQTGVMNGALDEIRLTSASREETLYIIRFNAQVLENETGISADGNTLRCCYDLAERFIKNGAMPAKAVSVLKQAVHAVYQHKDSPPSEWHQKQDKIRNLMESLYFATPDEKADIERKIGLLEQESELLHNRWVSEQRQALKLTDLETCLGENTEKAEYAKRNGKATEYGEIVNGVLPQIQKEIHALKSGMQQNRYCRSSISEADIMAVVSQSSGIPMGELGISEKARLLNLKERLNERVIGQERAVEAVSAAVLRSRSGLADPDKPYASFLFLGSTGVGKTLLCKELARFLFGDPNAMIRLDMSEYAELSSHTRLIGAPPGYIGFEEGGTLTEEVRNKPHSIILLDEMEKAHPKVLNLFLQVMDEGMLTDSRSNVVDFKNTIIIMTSNVGADDILSLKGHADESIHNEVVETLKDTFTPEFLNRIDELVVFNALKKPVVRQIAQIQLSELRKRLADKGIGLQIDDEIIGFLAKEGFDPEWGARPMKRMIQKTLINPIAEKIVSDRYKKGDTVKVGMKNGEIFLDK